jgi:hypothetical protein
VIKNYFNLSNVGQARPGLTGQILRMGLSPRMIAGASRFLGLPGISIRSWISIMMLIKIIKTKKV